MSSAFGTSRAGVGNGRRGLAEARLLKKASEVDVARGEFHDSSNVTFEVYARDWVENYRGRTKRGARPQTIAEYKRTLESTAIPYFGAMRLSEVTPRDIKR